MMLERGLIIRAPWIDLILQGKKTWEMRSGVTRVRGPIGLISQGSGLVVGTAILTDSRLALTRDDYMCYREKHAVPEAMLDEVLAKRWVFPWVLSDVRSLPQPVPYRHGSGPVIFVTLEPSVVTAIAMQDSGAVCAEASRSLPDARVSSSSPPSHDAGSAPVPTNAAVSVPAQLHEALFVFRPETAQAYGRPLEDGEFIVLAGSTAMRHGSPNVKRDAYERDRLVREGVLVPGTDPSRYRFTSDCTFTSCSKAAGVIRDGNASGPLRWKNEKTGRTLKDYLSSL
jgi:Domain of unknown function (DUF4357)/ASCH domain